jgi:hypothetical protein
MATEIKKFQVVLQGLRPLMFDRYAGDNKTQLPVEEKMYLTHNMQLIMPAINVQSLLAAENTKSVCRQFFGRQGKTVALGIASYTQIEPFEIPILDDEGPIIFSGFDDQIYIHQAVARLAKGVPNPKERPTLRTPWQLEFTVSYITNEHCTENNLRQAFDMGGILGLGTFRPYYGRYRLAKWQETK